MKRLILLTGLILAAGLSELKAQAGQGTKYENITLGSPEATEMMKYGNRDVHMYKGAPDIKIPIYTIEEDGIKLPIYLSYDATGIKVNQVATNVGLGWTLMAGGAITQAVYSGNDTQRVFSIPDLDSLLTFNPVYDLDQTDYIEAHSEFQQPVYANTQNDVFYYNYGSTSGKFLIDGPLSEISTKAYPVPFSRIKITADHATEYGDGFILHDETGNEFHFKIFESSSSKNVGCIGAPNGLGTLNPDTQITIPSYTWHLEKIVTSNNDEIIFQYDTRSSYTYDAGELNKRYILQGGSENHCTVENHVDDCMIRKTIAPKVLTRIYNTSSSLEIEFNYNTQRQDFGNNDYNALDNITVDKGDELISYNLSHSYFESVTGEKRLRLDSVTKQGTPPYTFTYNTEEDLPKPLSYAQDLWGFYNGNMNNENLVPHDPQLPQGSTSDRSVDTSKVGYWSMEKMTYPTGGETIFKMEADPDGGGLRVKEIYDKDGRGNVTNRRTYSYQRFSSSSHNFKDFISVFSQEDLENENPRPSCHYLVFSSSNVPIVNVTQSPDYGYDQVTVEYEGGQEGKSEYFFDLGYGNKRLGSGKGRLLEERHFEKQAGGYALVQKVVNTYESHDNYGGLGDNELESTEKYFGQLNLKMVTPEVEQSCLGCFVPATFEMQKYDLVKAWYHLGQKETFIYDPSDSTRKVYSKIEYNYDESNNVGSLRTVVATNSDGQKRKTKYKYAFEQYPGMAAENMLKQPYKVSLLDSDGNVIRVDWTLWKEFGNINDANAWKPCSRWNGGPGIGNGDPEDSDCN